MRILIHVWKKILGFLHGLTWLNKALIVIAILSIYGVVHATTPSPGHAWIEAGDAFWATTGTTVLRTFGFPDMNADVLTDFNIVQGDLIVGTAASTTDRLPVDTNATRYLTNKGGSNQPLWSTVTVSNGIDGILSSLYGGTGNASTTFTGPTAARTYTLPDADANILTDNSLLSLAQGGTGASLTASNGGILYSTGSAGAILSGVAAAGRLLFSGNSAAPTWSTAVYPSTAGASSSVMISTGTNFVTQDRSRITQETRPYSALGTASNNLLSSRTIARVGLFNLKSPITVNQISFTVTARGTPAGNVRICIYNEAGTAKLIDILTANVSAAGTFSTTVSPAVTLSPANYYIAALFTSSAGSATATFFGSTAVPSVNGASVPAGKKVLEGTTTMAVQDTCDSTLPTIVGVASSTLTARLDN